MTPAVLRRSLIGLVLATYGLSSTGGSGLHALTDWGSGQEQHDGSHHHDSEHGDCPICLVAGQGQLLHRAIPPTDPARVTIGGPGLPRLLSPRLLDHVPSDPRAPPVERA